MEETRSFAPLLIVIFLAFAVPMILTRFRRFRLPIVVAEILAGILVGRSGLEWVAHHDPVLDLLSEFGFVFLMFLAGMEIDFSSLRSLTEPSEGPRSQRGRGPVATGSLIFALTLGLSALFSLGLVNFGLARQPFLMALILSTTSLGIVVPVLKERGLSVGRFGQYILISALIADFVTMLLITVNVAILSRGLTLDILLVSMLFVAFFLMYRFGMFFFNRLPPIRRALEELSHATAQIKVRASFTMMLIFVVLSEVLGAEVILGAFLAGAIVALLRTPDDAELTSQLDTIGFGFFIPIFFIMVGVNFNLAALLESPQSLALVPLLVLLSLVVKIVPSLVLRTVFSWRETLAGGALLSARLSLIIAASEIGLRLDVISEATNAAIILVAALTATLAPLTFNLLLRQKDELRRRLVLIFGAANFGVQVGKELEAHGEQVCFLETDAKLVKFARREGFHVVHADKEPIDLAQLDLCDADSLLALSGEDEQNYLVSKQAMGLGLKHIVSIVNDPAYTASYENLGIQTFIPTMYRTTLLALLARNPDLFQLVTSTKDGRDVREMYLNNPNLDGLALSKLVLPGDSLILTVRRNGSLLIPHGNTRIQVGDRLTVIGDQDDLLDVQYLMEGIRG